MPSNAKIENKVTRGAYLYKQKTMSWRGNSIAYYDVGEGYPLLIIHGWGGNGYDYIKLIPGLEGSFRVLIPDMPGSGCSAKPRIHYTFDLFLDFLEEFLNEMGVRSFHLAGHSLGGHLSVHLIKRDPKRVNRLVLLAPTGLRGQEGFNGWISKLGPLVDLSARINNRWLVRFFARRNAFYDATQVTPDYLERIYSSFLTPEARYSIACTAQTVVGTNPIDDILPTLSHPTLIIWGTKDRLFPYRRWSTRYQELLVNSSLVLIENCGHTLTFERADDALKAMRPFLLGLDKSN